MSVLAYPRIHFQGRCEINPATANNDDVQVAIDAVNVKLQPHLSAMSHEQARAWLMETVTVVNPSSGENRAYLNSGWNYFGKMTIGFSQTRVTAVTGLGGATATDDAMVGEPVLILGSAEEEDRFAPPQARICDLDPTSTVSPQVFLGHFAVGDGSLGLRATCDTRAHSHWFVWRNTSPVQGDFGFPPSGATWQFALPRDRLEFRGPETSPALQELQVAAQSALGIVVQFCVYVPVPRFTIAELAESFQKKDYTDNPVESFMVGTVGVWEYGELMTAPEGRLLVKALDTTIGPATARVHRDRAVVSLNLISTFPENGYTPPLEKYDFGPIRLGFVPPGGAKPVPIGDPIAYERATYESTGGIVDVAYDTGTVSRSQLERSALVLLYELDSPTRLARLLAEADSGLTVATDDRGVYLEVGQEAEFSILVRQRGGPPQADVKVWIWEYQHVLDTSSGQPRAPAVAALVTAGSGLSPRIDVPGTVGFPRGRPTPLPVKIRALRPGAAILALTLDGQPLAAGNPWEAAANAAVRVLPQDDFSGVPHHVRTSWDFVFQNVWKYYHIVFPAMSQFVNLSSKADAEGAADLLVSLTDPRLWSTTHYMPPTRDLSAGKRALLIEWVKAVQATKRP